MGVRARSVGKSHVQPVSRTLGRPGEWRLPVRAVCEGGATLGREEKQQVNDVRETQPGNEVSFGSRSSHELRSIFCSIVKVVTL